MTDLFIAWDEFISTDDVPVLVRLDKLQASSRLWHISTSHESTFHPQPIAFARRLIAASKLFVEVTPYSESPVSTTFDLRGLSDAIKPLQDACHWRTEAVLPPADPAQSDSGEMDPKLREILDDVFSQQ